MHTGGNMLTVTQTAARLTVSPRAVLKWIHLGHFPHAYKVNPFSPNSHYRIPEQDVADFEAKRQE